MGERRLSVSAQTGPCVLLRSSRTCGTGKEGPRGETHCRSCQPVETVQDAPAGFPLAVQRARGTGRA